jgi:hypothetical protein
MELLIWRARLNPIGCESAWRRSRSPFGGRMTETVTIVHVNTNLTDAGGYSDASCFVMTVATRKAEVIQTDITESSKPFGEEGQSAIVFRIRYVRDMTTRNQLIYRGEYYHVRGIKEIGRRRGLELRCERVETPPPHDFDLYYEDPFLNSAGTE